jgi:hypothetical protein
MKLKYTFISALALSGLLSSCGDKEKAVSDESKPAAKEAAKEAAASEEVHDHAHDEVSLGSHDIEGIKVEAAQGHGKVDAGKEGHLVIKLPYKDDGETVVRAWIGTEDKTQSAPGKGEYAPSHDDYDIHTVAPSPLPENAAWWLEITKPDGTKATGSIPLLK